MNEGTVCHNWAMGALWAAVVLTEKRWQKEYKEESKHKIHCELNPEWIIHPLNTTSTPNTEDHLI